MITAALLRGGLRMNYDIIIIGAGPGGIFSAYELIRLKSELKVAVIEAAPEESLLPMN